MSEKASMRELVEAVAGPRQWSDTRQSWLNRAARRSGLTFRTIKAVWYGEINDPKHPAIQLLQVRAGNGLALLAEGFETIARGLESLDAHAHRSRIDDLLNTARTLRGLDRAGTDQA